MKSIAIIGMGTMGASIAGSIKSYFDVIGLDKEDGFEQVNRADMIILAVKPQSFLGVSNDLKKHVEHQKIISIMAGVTTERISECLSSKNIIRTMPSLALSSGKSLTAAYSIFGKSSDVEYLLNLWGDIIWLDSEDQFDSFTALAGSGPAYFLELAAQLQKSAERLGFDKKTAQTIANKTLSASAAILGDELAADKLKAIASKGGTTEAALKTLEKHQLGSIVAEAVDVARKRSEELSA